MALRPSAASIAIRIKVASCRKGACGRECSPPLRKPRGLITRAQALAADLARVRRELAAYKLPNERSNKIKSTSSRYSRNGSCAPQCLKYALRALSESKTGKSLHFVIFLWDGPLYRKLRPADRIVREELERSVLARARDSIAHPRVREEMFNRHFTDGVDSMFLRGKR